MAKDAKAPPRPGPLVWAASLVLLTLAEAGHRTAASGLEAMGPAQRDAEPGGRDNEGRKDGKDAVKPSGAGPQPGEAPTRPTPDKPASPKGV